MPRNYDSTNVGVPYVRANNITIQYPPGGIPTIFIQQAEAVKLHDGKVRELGAIEDISVTLDMTDTSQIPLVDPTSGEPLGPTVTLQTLMLGILAVIRKHQKLNEPPES